ncbi:MAG: sirohydrochlorin cobaltochelatase [Lachnospiraceae bacterium]|nr:sirohydrochlorin cobaltochelatase [Lachnospiraceae bacterium]
MKKFTVMAVMMLATASLMCACSSETQPEKTLTEQTEVQEEVAVDEVETEETEETDVETEVEEEDEENYETGDASLDDPLNADGIGEQEIMVVSFGTSFNDSRRETIGAIEKSVIAAFPEWDVRRGFTAQIIIDHVFNRDGEVIDNFGQAMDRAVDNGVKVLVIQPTHLMEGFEYNDVVDEAANYADAFEKIAIGRPLLDTDDDFDKVADIITAETAEYVDDDTAVVFMGHGTEAASNGVYAKMQTVLNDKGYDNYFICTVEAEPSFEDVIAAVKDAGYTKVVLEPLMIVAGDHANNDMAGDEDDSLKSMFEAEGIEVTCVIRGLGSMEGIQEMLVQKAQDAVDSLN